MLKASARLQNSIRTAECSARHILDGTSAKHAGLRGGMNSCPSLSARLSPGDRGSGNGLSVGLRHDFAGRWPRSAADLQLRPLPPPPPLPLPQLERTSQLVGSSVDSLVLSDSTASIPASNARSEAANANSSAALPEEQSLRAASADAVNGKEVGNGDVAAMHCSNSGSGSPDALSTAGADLPPDAGLRQRFTSATGSGGGGGGEPAPPTDQWEGTSTAHISPEPVDAASTGTGPPAQPSSPCSGGGGTARGEAAPLLHSRAPQEAATTLQHAPSAACSNGGGGSTALEVILGDGVHKFVCGTLPVC